MIEQQTVFIFTVQKLTYLIMVNNVYVYIVES
jgi:hypothetical protein